MLLYVTTKRYCKTGYFSGHIIFTVGRIRIFADAGTEHSSVLLFYCHIFPISIELLFVLYCL